MKKLISVYLFLAVLGLAAQTTSETSLVLVNNTDNKQIASGTQPISINETFEAAADRNNIPYRKLTNLVGVEEGYYIITGVFSHGKNLKRALQKLKKKFTAPGYINNPENDLNYVYAQYHPYGLEAVEACISNVNPKNTDKWILEVVENIAKEDILTPQNDAPANELNQYVTNLDNSLDNALTKANSDNPASKSKLLQRADHYFNKMWYAEAAKLYEEALKKGAENYSFVVIRNAADAHYFNTNMEKALQWYDFLYENYKDDMSADNIFRYAHSLKGTGKYSRSKRLMRLYGKKTKEEGGSKTSYTNSRTSNEVVLDKILKTSHDLEIKNLAINSKYSEFSPMFFDTDKIVFSSAKDSSFFNTRRYKWNDQPYLDLYVAKINEESQDLKEAIKFSKKINTKYHEASVTFSPDNTTLYFTRNNYGKKLKRDKNGINHLKIYRSTKVNGEWTEAIELPFNSDNYSTGHPALSPDGRKLYFVSDMPGTIGMSDIFVVDVFKDGTFSKPLNLGPNVNTEKREMFPFISDEKLYFSSDGRTGIGGLDVFEAAYTEVDGFDPAINLGKPINSKLDDFSYIVNEDTQQGFFASNRSGGKGDDDIYSFRTPLVEEVPENLNVIAGVVAELQTGSVMPEALVQLFDENNIKLKEMLTEDDGSFVFEDLQDNTKYTLKTTYRQYFDDERPVDTKENETINVDISLKKLKDMIAIEDGIKKLKTEIIHFDFDKSYIRNDAAKELDKLVEVMSEYPQMVIKIESHTDSRGEKAYNEYLSDKRAKSTRDYIISKGIDPERIESAIGYGENRLLNECNGSVRCSEVDHYLNRRSEFIITNM
ncbi:OmpA family protein [uncultured Kriegella sp.]|uniref:OmpA family protein n=1 Tax=uncultured Kriegella sp. TaxID=1798910 RepID=UPI0030DC8739|tara:strand:- start:134662 stop:137142 length:2481 start_codon:yes stop_codon:yes gene_type:complete